MMCQKVTVPKEMNIGFDLWKSIFAFLESDVKQILILCQIRKEWTFQNLSSLCTISWSPQHAMRIKTYSQFKYVHIFWLKSYGSVVNDLLLLSCQHFKRLKMRNATYKVDLSACLSCSNLELECCQLVKIPTNIKVLICSLGADVLKLNILGSALETLALNNIATQKQLTLIARLPQLCNLAIGFWSSDMLDMGILSSCTTLQRLRLPTWNGNYHHSGIPTLTQLIYLDMMNSECSPDLSNMSNLLTLVLRVADGKLPEFAEYDVRHVKEIILVEAPLFFRPTNLSAKITYIEYSKYQSQYWNFQCFNT